MTNLSPTSRSSLGRNPERAKTDRDELRAILDEGLICHLGIQVDGSPRVLPTGYGRIDDTVYLHGSTGARYLREGAEGPEVCAEVTLLDGVVYARSVFHNSMNYRSAVVHGRARPISDPDEKWQALRAITEHLAPGSWDTARSPDNRELAATAVLALDLAESSVKVRAAGPADDESDMDRGCWAGVLPLHQQWGTPQPCEQLPGGIPVPDAARERAESSQTGTGPRAGSHS